MSKKEKIQWMVIGLIVLGTAVFLLFREQNDTKGAQIWVSRPENGTKKQSVAMSIGELSEEWTFEVNARQRSEEEIETAFSESIRILNEALGVENGEAASFTESVMLPQMISETGVEIRWTSSDNDIIAKDGTVQRAHLDEVCTVNLQAHLSFAGEEREHWFTVNVPPYEAGSNEALLYGAQEELHALEAETVREEGFYLPEDMKGVTIGLPKESDSSWGLLLGAGLCLPFVLVFAKRREKEKERKQRAEELLAAYPGVITKLTLYTGAGLSLRGAWERLATEYRAKAEHEGNKDAVAEEVLILAGELKNGTSEARAYEAFGRRIGLKPYLRCASLLVSQIQKGSGGLRKNLEEEVRLAWEMHREQASKKGEEAQTKLLFPMMGMLFLVMAVVMIPAFFAM